jgi:hypothetical protein
MAASAKLDLYKEHKAEYVTPKKPTLVDTGEARYLAIDGQGEPGGEQFSDKIGALYGAAFTIKMASKAKGRDYKVCALEALWWSDSEDFAAMPKQQWRWKVMIRTPDFVGQNDLDQAVAALRAKGKDPSVAEVRLETIDEGRCVQVLHVGPYDAEDLPIQAMAEFAAEQGLSLHGKHHEIYLSDPRRVPPERLRTILRRPVRP